MMKRMTTKIVAPYSAATMIMKTNTLEVIAKVKVMGHVSSELMKMRVLVHL
jgi:hypothetical protein